MALTGSAPFIIAQTASAAARIISVLSTEERNDALTAIHAALAASKDVILRANTQDLEAAGAAAERGELSQSLLKRLDLGRKGKWEDMLKGILDVRELKDPVGQVTLRTQLDDGLELERVTCPIGVLLVIFEARPEVIANITSLAIKSGNAAILKGGRESTETFHAIATVISKALDESRVPNASIQLVTTRDDVSELLSLDKYIDLVIPRGSNQLVQSIKNHTRIPVLGHADGICSIYLHESADPATAARVIIDAKTGYPAACNSIETLLVDEAILATTLVPVAGALLARGVRLRCDAPSKKQLSSALAPSQSVLLQDATDEDYATEFLDLILALKTIPAASSPSSSPSGVDAAIEHINTHSSHHTDAIVTTSAPTARRFLAGVDSAGVFWNTSTRMADGMRFGFGTEVGISTNKIHARGPVGLEGLVIYKYLVRGTGHVAGDYSEGEGGKAFLHRPLPL
ncbi:MAG: hypothetical protein M1838_006269 [Thelocarpon superellum]|nr:MAG: hypothetical protein M1838_006269 [Thelocarpon superellum]